MSKKVYEFIENIPFDEKSALSGEDYSFRVGSIEFSMPLFTLNKLDIFNTLIYSQKLKAVDVHLYTYLRETYLSSNNESENEPENKDSQKSISRLIEQAYRSIKRESGYIPQSITDVIMLFAEPADIELCENELLIYFRENGINEDVSAFNNYRENSKACRELISLYLSFVLTVDKVLELIQNINEINTKVKKKMFTQEAATTPGKSRLQKVFRHIFKKN